MSDSGPVLSHKWEPIEDLPEGWRDLCRDDLHAVHRQWVADRALIKDESKLKQFQEKLAILWAIETGIIERLYQIDRGVTIQILEVGMEALGQFHTRGLSADARALITDQREALEMVMDLIGGEKELSTSYLKELQHRLTLSQSSTEAEDQFGRSVSVPLLKGEWKHQPNNPRRPDGSIHQYCPPEFVQDEVERLLAWREEHELLKVCPEVEAAWLHHRFAQIHPFQDGNGRVARAITSAVFLRADYLVLVVRDEEHRERYLDALEAADRGDLKPLVDLFADIQIGDLQEAISALRELRGEPILRVAESIAERAKQRKEASQEQAAGILDDLIQITRARLEEAAGELERAFGKTRVVVQAQIGTDEGDSYDWWSWQIIEAARTHQYFVDLNRPRRWVSLRLSLPEIEQRQARLVISFHAVGRSADLHAATAFLTNPLSGEEGTESRRWESETIPQQAFKFGTETAQIETIEQPFRDWLERTVEDGLGRWGEQI